jgi:transposase InsO family protein
MAPSSPPTRCATDVGSRTPARATSNPEAHGRTRGSSPTVTLRDELLAIEQFDSLLEAQRLVADWRDEFNDYRPHSALGMLTPTAIGARWHTEHQHQPS